MQKSCQARARRSERGSYPKAREKRSALVRETGRFGLNVLGSSQSQLALNFARKGGAGKFAGVGWEVEAGVPRIPGAGGFLACEVDKLVDGGDHVVVVGAVLVADAITGLPLTYHARTFGTHVALREEAG